MVRNPVKDIGILSLLVYRIFLILNIVVQLTLKIDLFLSINNNKFGDFSFALSFAKYPLTKGNKRKSRLKNNLFFYTQLRKKAVSFLDSFFYLIS